MKRVLWILPVLACSIGPAGAGHPAPEHQPAAGNAAKAVQLRIATEAGPFRAGGSADIRVMLTNSGQKPVTLVHPGDGSDNGRRTPIIGVSILLPSQKGDKHPETRPLVRGGCGNINPLKRDEVFELGPGATAKGAGSWPAWVHFSEAGTYRVRFYYRNDPTLQWKGIPLGTHDPEALRRLRTSYKCSLVSNELVFSVKR